MSITNRVLRSIDRSARRAIARKLLQLARRILKLRAALILGDAVAASAAFQRLEHLVDDGAAQSASRHAQHPQRAPLVLDSLQPLSPSDYEVRAFDREYGDLDEVIVVESFAQAVQLAVDRIACRPGDRVDAHWSHSGGSLTVRTQQGSELVCIQAFDKPVPTIQPLVSRACQALENGDPLPVHQLFAALRRVA